MQRLFARIQRYCPQGHPWCFQRPCYVPLTPARFWWSYSRGKLRYWWQELAASAVSQAAAARSTSQEDML